MARRRLPAIKPRACEMLAAHYDSRPFGVLPPVGLFRDREEFTADVTRFCDDLRATKPVDPAQPVMMAGDPQWNNAAKRMQEGIPVGPGLLNQIRQIAQACAAPWVLD
jgi:LDH2 family malate/lactate/ureidoglycolate dehydrogenase